jgi:hypothetical protein
MQTVTTVGLDIAKSVFQVGHRPRTRGPHPGARKGVRIVRRRDHECGSSLLPPLCMEDNGDAGDGWTPDFPTRFLQSAGQYPARFFRW